MTLSHLIHEQHSRVYVDRARQWARRNWQRYFEDGILDTEALAAKAIYEYGITQEEAAKLADDLKKEVAPELEQTFVSGIEWEAGNE